MLDKPNPLVLESANLLGIAGDTYGRSQSFGAGRQLMTISIDSSEQPAHDSRKSTGPVTRKSLRAFSLALLPGLHPIARADVLGRVEQNRVRLLTSQRARLSAVLAGTGKLETMRLTHDTGAWKEKLTIMVRQS